MPFRSDLSCTAASTNYFIATWLFGEGDAARIDDLHNDDCVTC
jgi:hypothetical protein